MYYQSTELQRVLLRVCFVCGIPSLACERGLSCTHCSALLDVVRRASVSLRTLSLSLEDRLFLKHHHCHELELALGYSFEQGNERVVQRSSE